MGACLKKDLKIMKLLIKYNADINKPSNISLKDKDNKSYLILIHPIFIASIAGDEFLKVILHIQLNL
jgi:hypothetical protein